MKQRCLFLAYLLFLDYVKQILNNACGNEVDFDILAFVSNSQMKELTTTNLFELQKQPFIQPHLQLAFIKFTFQKTLIYRIESDYRGFEISVRPQQRAAAVSGAETEFH